MSPAMIGMFALLVAFVGTVGSVVLLVAGYGMAGKRQELGDTLSWGGRVAALVGFGGLTVCVAVLAYCFLVGDYTVQYVLDNHSSNQGPLAWLFKLAGVWAGREGSLLFWAWLIGVFGAVIAARKLSQLNKLDNLACLVMQMVLVAFVSILLFSEANMPFEASEARYFTETGELTTAAKMLGMNSLLEHWAMAVHPPMLFVGYAGLTVPFAYAIAALVANDASAEWVQRSTRYALLSWLFLTAGIGLGAVWAYVVLGWGGYWGWDPVENASLLSWLMAVALIHSFTVYRQRGAFKGWSVMCACLTFAFVVVGTFISRSGLVQSVHAFEGDPVSLVLFGALIVASIVLGGALLIWRRGTFGPTEKDNFDSFASKGAMYYLGDVILLVMTLLITYMTISSALPTWLPFGGESLATGSYNIIARPIGVLFLGMMAVCPLFSWQKASGKSFFKRARVPALCAAVLFAVLLAYFVVRLSPAYDAEVAVGGSIAEALLEQGPAFYYKGLTIVGFAVAALLLFNALFMAVRQRKSASALGGAVSHLGMAIILIGLIGSSMYVTERAGYMPYDGETDTCPQAYTVGDYRLEYTGNVIYQNDNGNYMYQVEFDVFPAEGENLLGHVTPSVELVSTTQQQKLNAGVLGTPLEDVFVVYRGMTASNNAFSLDVRVNPLINCVWLGFGVLMVGMLIGLVGRRTERKKQPIPIEEAPAESEEE